jgi:hypothetical protein
MLDMALELAGQSGGCCCFQSVCWPIGRVWVRLLLGVRAATAAN